MTPQKMRMVELILDEENAIEGVQAMGVVTKPAIGVDFVAFKDESKIFPDQKQFAEVNKEKRILLGPAMIPNLPIYREDEDGPYYQYYTAATVQKAMQLYMKNGRQNSATLEHEVGVGDMTIVESWLVDDPEKDKSQLYGFKVPRGTWMISMKVYNEKIWEQFIKTGVLKGFSIEGFFSDSETEKYKKRLQSALKSLVKLKLCAKQPRQMRTSKK